ncbi:hypothetical protein llap_12887 [Limosa lapponica baueri]|uniref:Uncharacterized protein n=1 Tax=Limosa lapponica baueri TaxID=1758121 RepID=A0A2I0TSU0_LIMLA|nr:hypothetical protein llap_12887 [Limosa lapponica baueri]
MPIVFYLLPEEPKVSSHGEIKKKKQKTGCVCVFALERVVLKLQLKTHKEMVVDTILDWSFFSGGFGVAANHTLTLTHRFCGNGKKEGFKRQTDVT